MVRLWDLVTRNSHKNDLYFVVVGFLDGGEALLSCISHRLWADAEAEDLVLVERDAFLNFKRFFRSGCEVKIEQIMEERKKRFQDEMDTLQPGRVLHIDGDGDYLKMCLAYYQRLGVPAVGKQLPENRQPEFIEMLLLENPCDILVLTGHDALKRRGKAEAIYTSSPYFAQAVRKARMFQSSKDALTIFAGACQSNYKELMEAGANFASSPERIFIHALDPVFVAERIAYTTTEEVLPLSSCIENTMTREAGIGGISSRGALRFLSPVLH